MNQTVFYKTSNIWMCRQIVRTAVTTGASSQARYNSTSFAVSSVQSSKSGRLFSSKEDYYIRMSRNGEERTFSSSPDLTPDKSHYVLSRQKSEYKLGKHRSNALELLQKQPVIEVEGNMAVCDGGGGALGHPLEYIKLGARADYGQDGNGTEEDGVACIYCGLRYRSKSSGHHDHH